MADMPCVSECEPLLAPQNSAAPEEPQELRLHAISTRAQAEVLPALLDAIDQASGWVLQHHMAGPAMLQLRLEAQGRALIDVYASLVQQGLELTRASHELLTERCNCAMLQRGLRNSIVSLRLSVTLPSDLPPLFAMWRLGTA